MCNRSLLWALSPIRGGLDAVQLGVRASVGHQFVMGPDFDNACTIEYDNQVSHANRTEPMRYQDGDSTASSFRLSRRGVAFEQRVLRLRVQCSCRLVEYEQQGIVAHEAARQSDFLPLTERHIDAFRPRRPKLRVEAGLEMRDDIGGSGPINRGGNGRLFLQARQVTPADAVSSP